MTFNDNDLQFAIRIDDTGFQTLYSSFMFELSGMRQRILTEIGKLSEETMKKEAPVRKGQLRASIKTVVSDDGVVTEPTSEHAIFIEKGTRPHTIRAKGSGYLRFPPSGATGGPKRARFKFAGKSVVVPWIFRKEVFHPGTKANPFVERTRKVVSVKAPVIVRDELRDMTGRVRR